MLPSSGANGASIDDGAMYVEVMTNSVVGGGAQTVTRQKKGGYILLAVTSLPTDITEARG